ncbi:MAG: PepSY domain-containing protein [Saprospiraceae bacterium]|nr:PepSY domain-containing protein [Saprospiraceae bacterium]
MASTKIKSFENRTHHFLARSWKALNYQLHNVLGFYALLLLFVMAFSGLYISRKNGSEMA